MSYDIESREQLNHVETVEEVYSSAYVLWELLLPADFEMYPLQIYLEVYAKGCQGRTVIILGV